MRGTRLLYYKHLTSRSPIAFAFRRRLRHFEGMWSRVRITLLVVLAPVAALMAEAEPLSPKELDRVIEQLGADEFKVRETAQLLLAKQARAEPEAMRAALEKHRQHEENPEIQFRIERLLSFIARLVPFEKVPFTKAALAAKHWEFLGEAPEQASYELKEELLEIHSLDQVKESMGFVHRIKGKDAQEEPRGPGVRPDRFVLDAEIRILKEHHIRNGLAGMHLNVEDGRTSSGLIILEDGVFLYRHGKIHEMDTTDKWHHFRFVIEGDHQWVFVDDMAKPVFAQERPKGTGRWWATFGDGTSGAGVHAQVRNVTFSRYKLARD